MKTIYYRISLDVVAFISIIFGWWFLALPVAIFGLFKFRNYWEIIILGIIYDSLFRMVDGMAYNAFIATITTILLFVFYNSIKGLIRR